MKNTTPQPEKTRVAYVDALPIAEWMRAALAPHVARVAIVGSIRRKKLDVGDVELLYIPQPDLELIPGVPIENSSQTAAKIDKLLSQGILRKRPNINGGTSWGKQIKLAEYAQYRPGMPFIPAACRRGFPVDLFAATEQNWWSLMICRTGPADANIAYCMRAKKVGLDYAPFVGLIPSGAGKREPLPLTCEEDFYSALNLPYLPPELRNDYAQMMRN